MNIPSPAVEEEQAEIPQHNKGTMGREERKISCPCPFAYLWETLRSSGGFASVPLPL